MKMKARRIQAKARSMALKFARFLLYRFEIEIMRSGNLRKAGSLIIKDHLTGVLALTGAMKVFRILICIIIIF